MLILCFHFKLSDFLWYSDDFLFNLLILISFFFEFIHESLWLISKLLNLLIDDMKLVWFWCILKEIISFYLHIEVFIVWIFIWWIGLLIWDRWKWKSVIINIVVFLVIIIVIVIAFTISIYVFVKIVAIVFIISIIVFIISFIIVIIFVVVWWYWFWWFFKGVSIGFIRIIFVLFEITCLLQIIEIGCFFLWKL